MLPIADGLVQEVEKDGSRARRPAGEEKDDGPEEPSSEGRVVVPGRAGDVRIRGPG